MSNTLAEDLKKVGKFKDWEVLVMSEASGKVCFAQSTPYLMPLTSSLLPNLRIYLLYLNLLQKNLIQKKAV